MPEVTANPTEPRRRSLASRIVGVFLLDAATFEEIENDPPAMSGAASVVLIAGLARGIGQPSSSPVLEILGSGAAGLLMWLVAGLLIWGIGVKQMDYTSSYPELLRTIGFAAAPLVLLGLGVLPLGPAAQPVWYVGHVWALLALVVAAREALDTSTISAVVTCLLALLTGFAVVAGMGAVLLVAQPAS